MAYIPFRGSWIPACNVIGLAAVWGKVTSSKTFGSKENLMASGICFISYEYLIVIVVTFDKIISNLH
jgi:hypothetical protein